ncbi:MULTISPECIES: copper-binding protein [Variovorax]|uniref:copper-binding protein n=1 Tax=Variovorax sp. 3P27G3 TaxID=2502214 RepID=UPI0010F78C1C|nr:copper-binding protein [Variovorax sp. 3P27G3]
MKKIAFASLIVAALLPATVLAQQKKMDDMKGMDMSNMKDMNMPKKSGSTAQTTHMAMGEVKSVDLKGQVVNVAHEPIKSLNWPAMTMGFVVKDKMLMDKLVVGKKVQLEFVQEDGKYVVTAVK